jgi:VanZ family protein
MAFERPRQMIVEAVAALYTLRLAGRESARNRRRYHHPGSYESLDRVSRFGGRWSILGTSLYAVALVLALVAPTSSPHARRGYLLEYHPRLSPRFALDLAVNVAAFLPLGWGLRRSGRRLGLTPAGTMIAAGVGTAMLSLTMETVQYFLSDRYSSIVDVAANTAGGIIGSVLAGRWERRGTL